MQLTPRHYQDNGINWLTTANTDNSARHLLTDVPGAGKTFQATEATRKLGSNGLVLCPRHLQQQWFDFICEQYPDDSIVSFDGTHDKKLRLSQLKAQWYIGSIQSLRYKHFYELFSQLVIAQHIQTLVIDESHYIRGRDTQTAKNALALSRLVPNLILLTATPIVKDAADLYMQLKLIDPQEFHSFDAYLNKYCYYSWSSWGPQDITLRKSATVTLSHYMIGRTYADIGLELPPLVSPPQPITSNMIPERRKAYNNIRSYWYTLVSNPQQNANGDFVLTANSAMEVMHMLRHIISAPEKQSSLCEHLADDPGPYLIACYYRDSARELQAYLAKHHPQYQVTVITGEVPAEDRVQVAKAAIATPNSILIATIPSITDGCDLSACSTVYFYEEDWTPGKMYQFLSRVRRHRNTPDTLGVTITEDNHLHIDENPNDRAVTVKYFHAKDSMDQHIHAVRTQRAVNIKDLVRVELLT